MGLAVDTPSIWQNIFIFTITICWINILSLYNHFRHRFLFGLIVLFPLLVIMAIPLMEVLQSRVLGIIIAILTICYILYLFFLNYKYMKDNYKKERLGFIILSSIVITALLTYMYENNLQ